jgi:Zn-dependent peptidase ImmA (M78 family)
MDIKEKVLLLMKKYKTNNPFEIAEILHAIIIQTNLIGVRGFYQYYKRNDIIYIDNKLNDHDKRTVCAHDLGHMLLHRKMNTVFLDSRTLFVTSKFEKEANFFAVNLLVSDSDLEEYKFCTIEQLSKIFGVDEDIMQLRLKSSR